MIIKLPWPDSSLNPNRKNGRHWGATKEAKDKRMADARWVALVELRKSGYVPPVGRLSMSLTFCQPDKRRRDMDNLLASMKSDLDGISQALGLDDQHFDPLILKRGEPIKGGCVLVEVGCSTS